MQEYKAGYKWTGTTPPNISSDLQAFKIVKESKNGDEYDYAISEFKKP